MTTFHLKLLPQRRDDRLHLEKQRDALLLNGEVVDPSKYDEAGPASQWIVGRPEAIEDGWCISIILPHGSSAPRATRFPIPIVVSSDGPVELPPYEGRDEDIEEVCAAVAAKLMQRKNHQTTANGKIIIPKRLTLKEMPHGVYFSETVFPFGRFSEFGAIVADVIATASLLELEMLRVAVSQHGSNALDAVRTAFTTLSRDEGKRRDYIKRVAEHTGRKCVSETISWAYNYSRPLIEVRNFFSHHIWGECSLIPNALLLADPMDRLTGQAALSQLLSHQQTDKEVQLLAHILSGEGGSKVSEADAKVIAEMILMRQNNPRRIEAFSMTFGNPLDLKAPAAELWTAQDFRNAALAAGIVKTHVFKRLQRLAQWLNGIRAEDDLEPWT